MPDKFFSTVQESRIPKRDTGVAACRSHPLRFRKSRPELRAGPSAAPAQPFPSLGTVRTARRNAFGRKRRIPFAPSRPAAKGFLLPRSDEAAPSPRTRRPPTTAGTSKKFPTFLFGFLRRSTKSFPSRPTRETAPSPSLPDRFRTSFRLPRTVCNRCRTRLPQKSGPSPPDAAYRTARRHRQPQPAALPVSPRPKRVRPLPNSS